MEITKKVILTANAEGKLFTQSLKEDQTPKLDKNGKPYGFIRVENPSKIDLSFAYNNGGIKRGTSALIPMTVEAWEKAKSNYKSGMEIDGQVIILESLEEQPGFTAKLAGSGDDAIPCTINGEQIYRLTKFTSDQKAVDTLIAHDNSDEIKEANVLKAEAQKGKVLND